MIYSAGLEQVILTRGGNICKLSSQREMFWVDMCITMFPQGLNDSFGPKPFLWTFKAINFLYGYHTEFNFTIVFCICNVFDVQWCWWDISGCILWLLAELQQWKSLIWVTHVPYYSLTKEALENQTWLHSRFTTLKRAIHLSRNVSVCCSVQNNERYINFSGVLSPTHLGCFFQVI